MSAPELGFQGSVGVCRVCGTRPAEKAIPFYCVKKSDLRPGVAPIYHFETPICEACIKETTSRRTKRYWITALIVMAVVGLAAWIGLLVYLGKDPSGTALGRLISAGFLAGAIASIVLVFAGIISIAVCSRKVVAAGLAVKDKKAELTAAGYTGFWVSPPKHLTIR